MAAITSPCGPAPPEAYYSDLSLLYVAIQAFGYAFAVRDKQVNRVVYTCDRAGQYQSRGKNPDVHPSKQRNGSTKKCGCKMRVAAKREDDGWRVQVIESTHNHNASASAIAHTAHRNGALDPHLRALILPKAKAGIRNAQILSFLRKEHPEVLITGSDITNITQHARNEELDGWTPIQWLLEHLQREGFNPSYILDSNNQLLHLFYVHPDAITLYQQHPDILLMDCTYKTNRFRLPLLNICAITGGNKVVQIGLAFLANEKEDAYNWALARMRELMQKYSIPEPISIVTDRELALMNSIDAFFPESSHFLCRWHVNTNILARTKRFFPGPVKEDGTMKRHPQFREFLEAWRTLLDSPTEEAYTSNLTRFHAFPDAAVQYAENTWLVPWKEKLVRYWVDQQLHFGVLVTSTIEGCHSTLKAYLQRGNGDLRDVFNRLIYFWKAQHDGIIAAKAQEQLRQKHSLNITLLAAVKGNVYDYALNKIVLEQVKLPKDQSIALSECNCTITQSTGLPCYHTIWRRQRDGGVILPEDIHVHWYYTRPNGSTSLPSNIREPILNPQVVRGKGRPKGAFNRGRKPDINTISGTKRLPSAFELPSSSAPPAMQSSASRTSSPPGNHAEENYTTRYGRVTSRVGQQRIKELGIDSYEPGTMRERAYQRGISSIYHTDSIEDTAKLADKRMMDLEGWDEEEDARVESQKTQDCIIIS